jgi:hypothetical protein
MLELSLVDRKLCARGFLPSGVSHTFQECRLTCAVLTLCGAPVPFRRDTRRDTQFTTVVGRNGSNQSATSPAFLRTQSLLYWIIDQFDLSLNPAYLHCSSTLVDHWLCSTRNFLQLCLPQNYTHTLSPPNGTPISGPQRRRS